MEAQQYEYEQNEMPRGFTQPINTFQGAIITLTNPEDDLYNVELKLRCMVIGEDNKPRSVGKPLLNEVGLNNVLTQLQAAVSRNTFLTNLDEKNVFKITKLVARTLAIDLMINKKTYDIDSDTTCYIIHEICCIAAFTALNRPKGEGERKFWKGTQQEITTRMENKTGGSGKGLGSLIGGMFK